MARAGSERPVTAARVDSHRARRKRAMRTKDAAEASSRRSEVAAAFSDLVGIDGHLELAFAIFKAYEWNGAQAAELARRLTQIRERREDANLYLAVIGEFSSGKSTLINALLRENLLPTSVVQATTAAATVLRAGPRRTVVAVDKDGGSRRFDVPD